MQLKSFVVVIIMATGIVTVNSSISIDMREAMVKTGIVPNVFENPPPKCLEVSKCSLFEESNNLKSSFLGNLSRRRCS